MSTRIALVSLVALVAVGCGGSLGPLGRFDGYGYTSLQHPFRVRATRTLSVAGPHSIVENFEREEDTYTEPLDDDGHRVSVDIDEDSDGEVDETVELYRYELFFQHDSANAEMWVRTIVFPKTDQLTALDVLLDRYVRAVSGAGNVQVSLEATAPAGEESVATRVSRKQEAQLGGREALVATLEIGTGQGAQRASIVIVRSELVWSPAGSGSDGPLVYPVVLLMVLRAPPADHDRLTEDFSHLVSRMELTSSPQAMAEGALACAPAADAVRAVQAFVHGRAGRILESDPSGEEISDCLEDALEDFEVTENYQGRAVAHLYRRGESPYASRPEAHVALRPAPPEVPADVPPVPGETPSPTSPTAPGQAAPAPTN